MKLKLFYLFIFSCLIIFNDFSFANSLNNSNDNVAIDSTSRESLLIGKLTYGSSASEITPFKVEAALNLAAILSVKYNLIPFSIRDSVATALQENSTNPSILTVADSLNAKKILFVHVDRIHNMLRMEISMISSDSPDSINKGVGYSLLHHMAGENLYLYDPALLESSQRALAAAVGDSMLFLNAPEGYRVYPCQTLVIGALEYRDNPSLLPKWNIFEFSVTTSYDAVEAIFEEARTTNDFVVYDIPTRDTIYSLFNMFIVENYRPPSATEIEALEKFEVGYYIGGNIQKLENSTNIELSLFKIIDGRLKQVKTESGILQKDDVDDYRTLLKELTKKLLTK